MEAKNIEDIYTLSPTQQGMLFHVLSAPDSGIYIEQAICILQGDFNICAFEQAWQSVIHQHSSLRTAFVWKNLDKPIQVVYRQAKLLIEQYNWCEFSTNAQSAQLQNYLQTDQIRGFDISEPPLMRLAIIKIAKDTYKVIWSSHHLILDAWSNTIILQQVFALYASFCQGKNIQLKPSRHYRDYIAWLKQQDLSPAENFWRRFLQPLTAPTPLTIDQITHNLESEYGQHHIKLPIATTTALKSFAQQQQLTLNTLMQGVWALLLSHYSGKENVVFGTVVSGRPPSLLGIDSMVGLFVNTLPMRIDLPSEQFLISWLKDIHSQQIKLHQYEYTPLAQIQKWSELPKGKPLFESILVFQNSAIDISQLSTAKLKIDYVGSIGHSNYPLTIRVTPSPELLLEVIYDSRRFAIATITKILEQFAALLGYMVTQPDCQLSTLIEILNQTQREKKATVLKERRQAIAAKLNNLQPKVVKLSHGELIKTSYLEYQNTLPLVVQPSLQDLDLLAWTKNNLEFIERQLLQSGGILLRNFNINLISTFEQFIKSLYSNLLPYQERSTPRTEIGDNIYTSTEYPAHQHIALHNEFSYSYTWPMKICFHCIKSAAKGGETPIADSRKVFQLLDPKIKERFIQNKVMYVRNYGTGIDLSWQEVFQTTDKSVVEDYCRKSTIEFEWKGNNLKTWQVRHAVAEHPQTEEMVWFNQAHLFHISNLAAEVRESMLQAFPEDLPRNAYYGDGSKIETSILDEIREAYQQATVSFSWQEGDILLLDNMLVAHGRNPFVGTRKVVVAMAEPFTQKL
ncbi:condensation domain-containing protein [Nostoc sp. FACHB-280]|uniref:condensation domain-containing protein n=1 Tax=Nostoc sp. FACHB-280 TaxID=2692839 RepID=UPI00168AE598|nr:condensation domain-containing protein [Nostoc sp. FACHB-280]MBD2498549.1 TauD/TfdA family dioxygenase [Nostoc sp. FACHB-280]